MSNQTQNTSQKSKSKLLREFVREHRWIHLTLGLTGNATFFVGSIFFLEPPLQIGTWLFIFGSLGMLLGSIGSAFVKYEKGEW